VVIIGEGLLAATSGANVESIAGVQESCETYSSSLPAGCSGMVSSLRSMVADLEQLLGMY
jgi:hypothetical protein